MLETEIILHYTSRKVAKAITSAIVPDNKSGDGNLNIATRLSGSTLKIRIGNCSRIETLQATLQDLFRCLHAAEGTFTVTERRRRKL